MLSANCSLYKKEVPFLAVMHAIKMPVNYSFEIENKNSIKLHSVLVHPQLRGICFRKIMK